MDKTENSIDWVGEQLDKVSNILNIGKVTNEVKKTQNKL
jgi:hypothetical protein